MLTFQVGLSSWVVLPRSSTERVGRQARLRLLKGSRPLRNTRSDTRKICVFRAILMRSMLTFQVGLSSWVVLPRSSTERVGRQARLRLLKGSRPLRNTRSDTRKICVFRAILMRSMLTFQVGLSSWVVLPRSSTERVGRQARLRLLKGSRPLRNTRSDTRKICVFRAILMRSMLTFQVGLSSWVVLPRSSTERVGRQARLRLLKGSRPLRNTRSDTRKICVFRAILMRSMLTFQVGLSSWVVLPRSSTERVGRQARLRLLKGSRPLRNTRSDTRKICVFRAILMRSMLTFQVGLSSWVVLPRSSTERVGRQARLRLLKGSRPLRNTRSDTRKIRVFRAILMRSMLTFQVGPSSSEKSEHNHHRVTGDWWFFFTTSSRS